MNIGVIEKIYTIQFLVSMARVTMEIPSLTDFKIRRTKNKNRIEKIIKEVIQEQKNKRDPIFGDLKPEPVRGFTVKQNEKVNIDGKIFRTRNKNLVRYNINIIENSEFDVTKHKVITVGEIKDIMKKYNIKAYDVGGLLEVLSILLENENKLYFTKMSNEEFEKSMPKKASLLKNFYINVLKELNSFPYKNDVLDENLNLLVKVNSEAQR
ncbi:hypothetical protein HDR59_03520 [bacterium]|nr:hypothetical protein [bacterium]